MKFSFGFFAMSVVYIAPHTRWEIAAVFSFLLFCLGVYATYIEWNEKP